MPLTGDSQVNKKAFGIAINSRKLARFHPLDREKTAKKEATPVPRDNQKPTFSDNPPMHLMVEHASLGATPVKPEAARGGGLKGQALRAYR